MIEVREDWLVLCNDARLGALNVSPKFKVSTAVVEPATRVLGDAAVFNRQIEAAKFNDSTVASTVNPKFNDWTWRLGTATIVVVDCIWINGLTGQ